MTQFEQYELYDRADAILCYESIVDEDVKDFFNSSSNLEGFVTLDTIDLGEGTFTIKELPLNIFPIKLLILFNHDKLEYEYADFTTEGK